MVHGQTPLRAVNIDKIPTLVITLSDKPERRKAAQERLERQGVRPIWYEGVNATVMGITPLNPYMRDDPVNGYPLAPHHIGIWISHYGAWAAAEVLWQVNGTGEEAVMILEDDADFHPDWKRVTQAALDSAPGDWDLIFPGSCACGVQDQAARVAERLYRARPQCLHCYIARPRAIRRLLETHRRMAAPIDVAMYDDSMPSMKVFAILPRVVDQMATVLQP